MVIVLMVLIVYIVKSTYKGTIRAGSLQGQELRRISQKCVIWCVDWPCSLGRLVSIAKQDELDS